MFIKLGGVNIQNGACYIRVSTDDQVEFSPDAQMKAIKKYAKENDIIITKEHIYIDEGISGRKAEKRPAFMRMIAEAKSKPKPFDIILVHKFDRFARSREDSVVYKSLLKKEAGIKVTSITESIEDDKFSVILEAMLEAMAEYYSLNLSDEVKKGMIEKAERGELQTCPAYGYNAKDNMLIINEEEAKIVKFIFEKFSSREMSLRQISLYLKDIGIKGKRGVTIKSTSVSYILNNPVYIGKLRWTPESINRNFNHSKSIIKDSVHEPIIDLETWNKTQELLKENKEIYTRYEKPNNIKFSWLCGLLRCDNCGYTLVKSSKLYFQCNAYVKGMCDKSNHISASKIENLVLGEIKKIFTEKLELKIVPKTCDVVRQNENEILKERLAQADLKEIRIKEAYKDGIDNLEEYKQNKISLNLEREKLKRDLELLKNTIIEKSYDDDIMNKIESVHDVLTNPKIDMDIKYKTAHFLIDRVLFSKEQKTLKITFK